MFNDKFYTKKDLMEILQVSLRTIDNMILDGRLKPVYIGKSVRFKGEDLNILFGAGNE